MRYTVRPSENRLDFARGGALLRDANFATVAQLVEQLIRNQQVSGSIPLGGFSVEGTRQRRL
jgi:hypothetical protein